LNIRADSYGRPMHSITRRLIRKESQRYKKKLTVLHDNIFGRPMCGKRETENLRRTKT